MTITDTDRAKLIDAAKIMEGLAKDKLADVSALRAREFSNAREISVLEHEIAKIKKANENLPDQLRAEARTARFLYDQSIALRKQASDLKVPNHWVPAAEAYLAMKSPGTHRLENASYTASLLTIDVFPIDDDMKIASIIGHSASVSGSERLFSVAGYRTKNGSPNSPFRSLEEALDCALAMERWHSDDDTMFISTTVSQPKPGENAEPRRLVNALGQPAPVPTTTDTPPAPWGLT